MNNAFLDPSIPGLLRAASRINVVGSAGSGKSTFARRLATAKSLPYIELDKLFWKPEWQESTDAEFFSNLRAALDAPGWVLDGNYGRTTAIKWRDVEVVVWLNLSLPRTLAQITRRSLSRALRRTELWETGNRESLRRAFLSRKSVIWWSVSNHGAIRDRYRAAMVSPSFAHIRFIELRSRKAIERCLTQLAS